LVSSNIAPTTQVPSGVVAARARRVRLQLGEGAHVRVRLEQLRHAARVAVAVDEPRHDAHPRAVDHARAGGREIPDVGVRAHREEAAFLHRERLGARQRRVLREHPRVHDDEVRLDPAAAGGQRRPGVGAPWGRERRQPRGAEGAGEHRAQPEELLP
jgi:hypothetical protein